MEVFKLDEDDDDEPKITSKICDLFEKWIRVLSPSQVVSAWKGNNGCAVNVTWWPSGNITVPRFHEHLGLSHRTTVVQCDMGLGDHQWRVLECKFV